MRGGQDDRFPGWLRVTLGTLGDIVLFAALSLVIWTFLPAIALGATPIIIGGGSMAPLIRAGDVILLDDAPPPEGEMFAPGTVITFEAVDRAGARTGELVTHRVARLSDGQYVTRGDANNSDDPRPVHPEQLVGVGRWLVPVVGLPAHWARSGSWHLVALTALGGIAAVAASVTGRRRVVIDIPDEAVEDLPIDAPIAVPRAEPVPVPLVAEPVLAFHLEPELPDGAAPSEDDGALDPAAAEKAAAVAAQAARRGLAGLDRIREEQDEAEDAKRRSRRGGSRDGSAGSAPIASIIALALALLGSTIAPSFAAAAYVATTSNGANSFTTAEAPTTPLVWVIPDIHGDNPLGQTSAAGGTSYTWTFATTREHVLDAPILATLSLRPRNAPGSTASIRIEVDGVDLSATVDTNSWPETSWTPHTFSLQPNTAMTIPAGAQVEVVVHLVRTEMQVGGPSTITFP